MKALKYRLANANDVETLVALIRPIVPIQVLAGPVSSILLLETGLMPSS